MHKLDWLRAEPAESAEKMPLEVARNGAESLTDLIVLASDCRTTGVEMRNSDWEASSKQIDLICRNAKLFS